MRIDQLKQVAAVAEHKSIVKAAEVLSISQPALSMSIKNLEKELGISIFDRSGRTLMLTDKGKEVYNSAKRILQEASVIESLKYEDTHLQEVLSIANSFTVLAKEVIIQMYNKYGSKYLKYKIEDCAIHEIIDKVARGESEIGVIRFPKDKKAMLLQLLAMKNLEYTFLAQQHMCIAVGEKNHLYRIDNNQISVDHIQNQTFATYTSEGRDSIWMAFLDELGVDYRKISLANVGHILNMVRNTDIAFVDTRSAPKFSHMYDGVRYIELTPAIKSELCYIKIKNRELSTMGNEFIETTKKLLQEWKDSGVEDTLVL